MLEDPNRIEIIEAYVKSKPTRMTSSRRLNAVPSLTPIRTASYSRVGHMSSSSFGGSREAVFPSDKWWMKKPVIAGESQTPIQKRLSSLQTASFKSKTAKGKEIFTSEFEFRESSKTRSNLRAEMTPEGASNWSNTLTLRQSLRSFA